MAKFNVGDLVKVDASELPLIGIPVEEVGGLLVINEVGGLTDSWYEVRNSDGYYYGLLENALVAV